MEMERADGPERGGLVLDDRNAAVVEAEPIHCGVEGLQLGGVDRVDRGEEHGTSGLVAWQRLDRLRALRPLTRHEHGVAYSRLAS